MDLRETYNLLAKSWAENNQVDRHQWCYDFITIFASRIGHGGKVLDVGCASGDGTEILAKFGLKVVGVDFSEKLIAEAQKNYPHDKFMVMDMRQLNFADHSFAGVLAKHSLLHLSKKEIPRVLNSLQRILKPDGWLLLTLKEGVGEREIEENRYGVKFKRFFAFYTSHEVENLLNESGFKIVEEGISKGYDSTALKFLAQKV